MSEEAQYDDWRAQADKRRAETEAAYANQVPAKVAIGPVVLAIVLGNSVTALLVAAVWFLVTH